MMYVFEPPAGARITRSVTLGQILQGRSLVYVDRVRKLAVRIQLLKCPLVLLRVICRY